MAPPKLHTPEQVAELLQYSTDTVYRLIRSGRLRAVRLGPGGHLRVSDADLEAFIASMDATVEVAS